MESRAASSRRGPASRSRSSTDAARRSRRSRGNERPNCVGDPARPSDQTHRSLARHQRLPARGGGHVRATAGRRRARAGLSEPGHDACRSGSRSAARAPPSSGTRRSISPTSRSFRPPARDINSPNTFGHDHADAEHRHRRTARTVELVFVLFLVAGADVRGRSEDGPPTPRRCPATTEVHRRSNGVNRERTEREKRGFLQRDAATAV